MAMELKGRTSWALGVASLAAVALASPLGAATVAPPANLGELARLSRSVVLARAAGSRPDESRSGLPSTITRFERLRHVAGEVLPETFAVSEAGGIRGGRGMAVGGSPAYQAGRTYLLFLDRLDDGRLRSRMMAYGLLVEDEPAGLLVPVEQANDIDTPAGSVFEPVTGYDPALLLDHLADVARGATWSRERAGSIPVNALRPPPAGCDFIRAGDGLPVRWFGYEAGTSSAQIRHTTPGQSGLPDGGVGAVTQGAAAWTNHPDSIIRYNYAGSAPASVNCGLGEEQGAVWFNDPCSAIPDLVSCSGTLAFGGVFFSLGTSSHDGEPWHPAAATFVVVNNGTQCIGDVNFREMMTHELGHTQGFGHHAIAPPPNNPTMSSQLKADGRGAALVGLDKTCASSTYHTFLDVPFASPAWRFVEAVENAGVTGGCSAGNYCPDSAVTREQMAAFLLLAREGATYSPPACTTPPFNDVPVSSPFCRWIRELAARSVTGGCTTPQTYCPTAAVTREQMAVFLLRTREGPTYNPPACVTPMFSDVPCSSGFAPWINELVRRGITGGCGTGRYCPGSPNTRAEMAIFLTTTFALPQPN
jgi:hypothetical protein